MSPTSVPMTELSEIEDLQQAIPVSVVGNVQINGPTITLMLIRNGRPSAIEPLPTALIQITISRSAEDVTSSAIEKAAGLDGNAASMNTYLTRRTLIFGPMAKEAVEGALQIELPVSVSSYVLKG